MGTTSSEAANSPKSVPLRNPVVLVHGFKDTSAKMQPMARALRQDGWSVYTPSLQPSWGQLGIDELAHQLAAYIDAHFTRDQRIDLVAFSMGGIISRYYLQRLGGMDRVDRLITISSPHRGTMLANLCAFPRLPGIDHLTLNSALLRDLNRDAHLLRRVKFTSIWTPLDLMILPASSSKIRVANNVMIWIVAHPLMVWQPRCHRLIAELLRD